MSKSLNFRMNTELVQGFEEISCIGVRGFAFIPIYAVFDLFH